MTSQKIPFRTFAKQHLDRARELFSNDKLLAATCLEVRMALECLVYESLQSFPDSETRELILSKRWQPAKILQELMMFDETVGLDRSVTITPQSTGVPIKLGTDTRLKISWISARYSALGRFVHTPTILDHRDGTTPEEGTIAAKINEIIPEIEGVLSSLIWNTHINHHTTWRCRCGFLLKVRASDVEAKKLVICASCDGHFLPLKRPEGWRLEDAHKSFKCTHCGKKQSTLWRNWRAGSHITCEHCTEEIHLVHGLEQKGTPPAQRD
jgi:DNA-directed RNA polymerase subunit RPC12/RpoP